MLRAEAVSFFGWWWVGVAEGEEGAANMADGEATWAHAGTRAGSVC